MSRIWDREGARAHRLRLGLSTVQVSDGIGVHRSQVYRWEEGDGEPLVRHAAALADFYGVSLDSLFTHDAEDASPPEPLVENGASA